MGVPGKILNQANYQTSQNYEIDIDKVYSDYITVIDSLRSIVNIQVNQSVLNVFDEKTLATINSRVKVEKTPQESRAHAFYRWIGFPVVGTDNQYYNPGLDTTSGTKNLTKAQKVTIANQPLNGFRGISLQRENYTNAINKIFSVTPPTITSTALALTSSTHTRSFTIPITSDDPFDFSPANQGFTADFRSVIGRNDQVLLVNYMDAFGNTPIVNADGSLPPGSDTNPLRRNRFHFIKPFMVDPRIDFSLNPTSSIVAVPFVPSKANLLVGENTYVKTPILEKIIRQRFAAQDQVSTTTTAGKDIINYILSIPAVKNEKIIQQMASGDIYKLGDQIQFLKYLNIIQAMCVKLVEAQKKIQIVQSRYYWLPLPNSNSTSGTLGPEGGSAITPPFFSTTLPSGDNNSFITDADNAVDLALLNQGSNTLNFLSANLNLNANNVASPDLGNTDSQADKGALTSPTDDNSQALGDHVTDELNALTKKRTHDMTIAAESLRTIEIIMGEWSGLGFCDIVAIMGALYTMPKTSLLGFLDSDAFSRMKTSLQLEDQLGFDTIIPQVTNSGINQAQTDFIAKVKDFYNLMDKIYQDLAKSQGLST